jgi:hypothetical protein
MIIVTGASSNHYRPLLNLLASLAIHEPRSRVITYDLGLTEEETSRLALDPPCSCELRKFDFSIWPPHVFQSVNGPLRSYAWKPIIISGVLHEVDDSVLWLDAGDLVHGSLDGIREILSVTEFYSPISSGDVAKWTYPAVLEKMKVPPSVLGWHNRNGAIVGFGQAQRSLAKEWMDHALDPSCICPSGSSRENHRQDQALLTILVYRHFDRAVLENRMLNVFTHKDKLTKEEALRICQTSI